MSGQEEIAVELGLAGWSVEVVVLAVRVVLVVLELAG